jgi:hypothetical protein
LLLALVVGALGVLRPPGRVGRRISRTVVSTSRSAATVIAGGISGLAAISVCRSSRSSWSTGLSSV